jgi:hypothetical protein
MAKIMRTHGVPGPAGSRGAPGIGGAAAKPGKRGARAAAAHESPDDSRMEVLAVVEGQIENIHHELDLQMQRITQLQRDVDEVRKLIQQLTGKTS